MKGVLEIGCLLFFFSGNSEHKNVSQTILAVVDKSALGSPSSEFEIWLAEDLFIVVRNVIMFIPAMHPSGRVCLLTIT